jgi:hypothetical protein
MEAFGLGGAVAHIAPELAAAMGQDWPEAQAAGRMLRERFLARHAWAAPALAGTEGIGLGLDARRVAEAREGVRIHTGIAHRDERRSGSRLWPFGTQPAGEARRFRASWRGSAADWLTCSEP